MSKKLNVNAITNELSEGSAFFHPYKSQPPKVAETPVSQEVKNPEIEAREEQKSQQQQSDGNIPEQANARTPVRPQGKRIITRNSFETYEDQMESLRKLSFEDKMEGKLGSMSAMVREAIDDYLQKRALQRKASGK